LDLGEPGARRVDRAEREELGEPLGVRSAAHPGQLVQRAELAGEGHLIPAAGEEERPDAEPIPDQPEPLRPPLPEGEGVLAVQAGGRPRAPSAPGQGQRLGVADRAGGVPGCPSQRFVVVDPAIQEHDQVVGHQRLGRPGGQAAAPVAERRHAVAEAPLAVRSSMGQRGGHSLDPIDLGRISHEMD
jgi:hypothetical protein